MSKTTSNIWKNWTEMGGKY